MKQWKLGLIAACCSGSLYAAPMAVVASFSILGDVTQQIGGERVKVTTLVGADQDAHAYHMTAGDAEGAGAALAMEQALARAGLSAEQVDYINLHGTATQLNDQIESMVVNALFGERVPCSSTKHLTGHTLGAAGITEAAISMLILERDLPLPAQDFSLSPRDPTLPPCGIIEQPQPLARPVILSNSFAFGGNNASILLGRVS